jgi:hypothetical protein
MDTYESDPILRTFIDDLRTIYYEFETTEARPASHPLKDTIDSVVNGTHCMGFGSDTILKTSYYYITHLLNQTSFDTYMTSMFPSIFQLEHDCVQTQLINAQPNTARYDVLQTRLQALLQPMVEAPRFVPADYENNFHVANQ